MRLIIVNQLDNPLCSYFSNICTVNGKTKRVIIYKLQIKIKNTN